MNSPTLLSVLIDCDSLLTYFASKNYAVKADDITIDIAHAVTSITSFLHSFAFLHRQNRIVVYGHGLSGYEILYPTIDYDDHAQAVIDLLPFIPSLSAVVRENLQSFFQREVRYRADNEKTDSTKYHLASVLSSSLCLCRQQQSLHHVQARMLVLQFDKDKPQNYNGVMNSIFSAQKLNIMVDSLVCSSFDSHLLQQVCFLTEGQYLRHGDVADLLLTLQTSFLTDKATRQVIPTALQRTVDFKASCHCHKKPVEFAFMCTVCLTLLCDTPTHCCPVCETLIRK